MIKRTLYHFHFCCGLGGGAAGFNRARPRVGNVEAEWVCLGGIDVDPAGLRDFERLAGVPGTLLDLFTRDQYVRFHGKEPPAGWREATPEDIRRAAVHGDVYIRRDQNSPMDRPSVIASILKIEQQAPTQPPLYDAQIHTMTTLGLVITGTEIIDGVAYAQSWHCRAA